MAGSGSKNRSGLRASRERDGVIRATIYCEPIFPVMTHLSGELNSLDLVGAAQRVADGDVSPVELTSACLERIAGIDAQVNAFITVTADAAMEDARVAERELVRGEPGGPLAGVPIALKDLFDTAGVRTTAGYKFFFDGGAGRDSEVRSCC